MTARSLRLLFAPLLLIAATLLSANAAWAQSTMVRLHTTQGPIDFKLMDAQAPKTVANFLAYSRAGDYTDVMFHRSVPSFVIQGGGFRWPTSGNVVAVTSRGNLVNEFSAARSNLRGTVAMAKLGGDPNSATSQWFINLVNNAANLDTQNGGFTVFATVTTPGMVVADRIAALQVVNAGSPFDQMPVANWVSGTSIARSNAVLVTRVTEFPAASAQSESDRVLNYLEAAYPQYLSPSSGEAGNALGYAYRYYSGSNAYVGTKDGKIYYLVPSISPDIAELGSIATYLSIAAQAGY